MSCIIVSVERVGKPMEVSADRIGSPMEVSADRIGSPMEVSASRIGTPAEVSASRIGKPMEVSARLVCTINSEFYLKVSPGVIWLNEDNNWQAVISVTANVKWIIE